MSSFNQIINSQQPVLIDFSAEWCQPCKMMAPILKELAKEMGDGVRILKIDVDRNPALAQKLQIQGVPTLVLYQKGKQLWRQSGVIPAHQLADIIRNQVN
jgi:thioredoxin 1